MNLRFGTRIFLVAALAVGLALLSGGAYADIKFKPVVTLPVTTPDNVLVVDLDNDGNLDIAGSSGDNIFVLYGHGDGTFDPPVYYPAGPGVWQVTAVDVNQDGHLDLVADLSQASSIAVLLNTGPRTFAAPVLYPVGAQPYGITAGDLNEDGYPDLIVANDDGNTISILINNGDGTFAPQVTLPGGDYPARCVVADFDGDGHLDIAESAYVSGDVRVYFGVGDGTFSRCDTYNVGSYPAQIITADFNNDGYPDLAVANTYSGTTNVLLNDGTGHFTVLPAAAANYLPHIMSAADLDGSGLLDLVIPNEGSSIFTVQRNLGGGYMGTPITFQTPGVNIRSSATGDLDGDGKPDVVLSDGNTSCVYIFFNDSDTSSYLSLSVSPTSLFGGDTATGTITIQGGVLDDTTVSLTSDNALVSVPASVVIPAGQNTATFTVTTAAVLAKTSATITASSGAMSASTVVNVAPRSVQSLVVNPSTLIGSNSAMATVTINTTALTDYTVNVSSDQAAVVVPATVTIPAGSNTASFTVTTSSVAANVTANLTATGGGGTASATLQVLAMAVQSLSVTPTTVPGGNSATATVQMNGTALNDTQVNLLSNQAAAVVPATVTVPAGSNTATFTVTTSSVSAPVTANLTATAGGKSASATLTVDPFELTDFTVTQQAAATTGELTFNEAAPVDTTATLSSDTPSVASVPSSITVPAGVSSADFAITLYPVTRATTVTFTATVGSVTLTARITVQPAAIQSLTITPNQVLGGQTALGDVHLTSPAPPGGYVVTLSTDNLAASVPASVTVVGGAQDATFDITTIVIPANASVHIYANHGTQQAVGTLEVIDGRLNGISLSPTTVMGGEVSKGTVTLNGPAPVGGIQVALASASANASVPAAVTIPVGQTSATFTVTTSAVAAKSTVKISAISLGKTFSTNLTILPILKSFSVAPASVAVGQNGTGTVTLNGPAPAGGLSVSLSSTNPAASVPASVLVPAGSTSATFTVSSLPVSASAAGLIKASAGSQTLTAPFTVKAPTLSAIAFNPTTVRQGQQTTGTVTLTANAAVSTVITLISRNSSVLSVPATVTVPAGSNTATFTATAGNVSTATTVTITAKHPDGTTKSKAVTVKP
jgi:hypothetical protein